MWAGGRKRAVSGNWNQREPILGTAESPAPAAGKPDIPEPGGLPGRICSGLPHSPNTVTTHRVLETSRDRPLGTDSTLTSIRNRFDR